MQIAVVGIGAVLPGCPTLQSFWDAVATRRSMARDAPPERWAISPAVARGGLAGPDEVLSRQACFVEPFALDPAGLSLDAAWLRSLDPMFHFALHAAREAWRESDTEHLDRRRVGVILGNIALPTERASALSGAILDAGFATSARARLGVTDSPAHPQRRDDEPMNRCVPGLPAGAVAQALELGGSAFCLDAACASSLYALKLACDELAAGRADAMLAGGLSRPDSLYTQMGFSQLQALSPRGRCAPFDESADGLVVGEGCGVLMLKRLRDAQRDGDRIHAVIAGIGLANDRGAKLMQPESEGQLRALRDAYRDAGWRPSDVDLVECHGTGTLVGDRVEFESLCALWRGEPSTKRRCVLSSVKANIGHLLTAAGAAGLIKVLLALRHESLPPATHFERAAPGIELRSSPFDLLQAPQAWTRRTPGTPRRAGVDAFGFGGINAHVLLEEWLPEPAPRDSTVVALRPRRHSEPGTARVHRRREPVAVVGLGGHIGPWSGDTLHLRLLDGAPETPASACRGWGGGFAREYRGLFIDRVEVAIDDFQIPPTELEEMLPQQLLMLNVAGEALADAGLESSSNERADHRTGVFVGASLDPNTTNFHYRWTLSQRLQQWTTLVDPEPSAAVRSAWCARIRDAALPALTANRTMGALASIIASRLARAFRAGGPCFAIAAEEASGLRALEVAVRALQRGELDVAIVGAVDFAADPRTVLARPAGRSVAADGRARPFDREASGSVPADGAVALVLRRDAEARERGERVYARVIGMGSACGPSLPASVPEAPTYLASLERALSDARTDAADIAYYESHGSGDPDEDRVEAAALQQAFTGGGENSARVIGASKSAVGHCGAASGLAAALKACLCLHRRRLTPLGSAGARLGALDDPQASRTAHAWLRDRDAGPRIAAVASMSADGSCEHVILAEAHAHAEPAPAPVMPSAHRHAALLVVRRADRERMLAELEALTNRIRSGADPTELARSYSRDAEKPSSPAATVALLGADPTSLAAAVTRASAAVRSGTASRGDGLWYEPQPLGGGALAFVYPGVGNHYLHMGRALADAFTPVLDRLDRENERLRAQFADGRFWHGGRLAAARERDFILAHVWLGALVTDVLAELGVRPDACIGYSLGETTALIATRAWRDRDELLRRLEGSALFRTELAAPWDAAKRAWSASAPDWRVAVVEAPAAAVQRALVPRVYLLIVNAPGECVIGGDARELAAVIEALGCHAHPVPGATSVHCEVVEPLARAYRELHRLPTTPPDSVRYYSGASGEAYCPSADTAAEAITALALNTVDFTGVIERAYADGVRLFLETGPGQSVNRMVAATLGARPHVTLGVCAAGRDELQQLLETLAALAAHGAHIDLRPLYDTQPPAAVAQITRISVPAPGFDFELPPVPWPGRTDPHPVTRQPARTRSLSPLIEQTRTTSAAGAEVHEAFLRVSHGLSDAYARTLQFRHAVLARAVDTPAPRLGGGPHPSTREPHDAGPAPVRALHDVPRSLDRSQCLEFAAGSIARVLGSRYASIDAHPTRVRLPDEPLMLVDRVTRIDGAPCSLGPGTIVTEHDVHADRWYLDAGRIPTAIAVEAGQADLLLSAFLGIDLETRGLAVYRLLDAEVTFHSSLPGPPGVIRYEIEIEQFFRQGDTHLFRFRFDASVDGAALLSMRNGCAGFFTQAELAAGQGIAGARFTGARNRGLSTEGCAFVPVRRESYDEAALARLRAGDLAGCFGDAFEGLPVSRPLTLPSGRLTLVHRIVELDPGGGYGLGIIRGEADIRRDDWFLACHFVDDEVMPGTLMFECCLHTLRIFLLRLGWVGETGALAFEPRPGTASTLQCRGQVTPTTRQVRYEVSLCELGYDEDDGTPYALADATMYADGRAIVSIRNMSVRANGLTRDRLESLWGTRSPEAQAARPASRPRPALFDHRAILDFAVGRPSDAFGPRFRVFDEERNIARLPGPPYQFLERIVDLHNARAGELEAGAEAIAQYAVPAHAWYLSASRQGCMPYCVLLEVALQPCGWLAAYLGAALRSDGDLWFRNLGGHAVQRRAVTGGAGVLTTRIALTKVSESAGMIILEFDFEIGSSAGPVLEGDTYFGFFSREALAKQVGIRDARFDDGPQRGERFALPDAAPYPDAMLRMIDEVEVLAPDGGAHGLGYARGVAAVRPDAWFFKAHFYQDPVWPGSLGLESLLQVLTALARRRWPQASAIASNDGLAHSWEYRGQILPGARRVEVEAVVKQRDESRRALVADGLLSVDGRMIYRMEDFSVTVRGE